MTRIVTLPVLAGAYRGKRASLAVTLTHSRDLDAPGEDGLCRQPNMADEFSTSTEEQAKPPTCPKCLRKDPRFAEVTGDTITDEEIRALRDSYASRPGLGWVGSALARTFYDAEHGRGKLRKQARAACAAIINADRKRCRQRLQ